MRSVYVPPTVSDYDSVFAKRRAGAGLGDIRVYSSLNRGGSLLGLLGRVFKYSLPIIKRFVMPEVHGFVSNVVNDVNAGKSIKNSLKSQGINSLKNVGTRIARGGGRNKNGYRKRRTKKNTGAAQKKKKRKRKSNSNKTRSGSRKKSYTASNDVFSNMRML